MKINYPQLIATIIAAVCSVVALCFQLFGVEGQGFITAVMAALLALCVCDMHDVRVLYKALRRKMSTRNVILMLYAITLLFYIISVILYNLTLARITWLIASIITLYVIFLISIKKIKNHVRNMQ
jgi:amino acid transporter